MLDVWKIVKALECCIEQDCLKCPYIRITACCGQLKKDTIKLIEEMGEEITKAKNADEARFVVFETTDGEKVGINPKRVDAVKIVNGQTRLLISDFYVDVTENVDSAVRRLCGEASLE